MQAVGGMHHSRNGYITRVCGKYCHLKIDANHNAGESTQLKVSSHAAHE